jgi:hypothetical protein
MTYCPNQWISSFTYNEIYSRLMREDLLPDGAGGPLSSNAMSGQGNAAPAGMQVTAALNLTRGEGAIDSVLPADVVDSPEAGGAAEPYAVSVRTRDSSGAVLDERPGVFQRSVCQGRDDDVTGILDVVIPVFPDAASIEVLVDGEVMDSHPVGGEPVEVGPLVHAERETTGPSGRAAELDIRWNVSDAPPSQRYIVEVSDDSGTTWQTVGLGLIEPAVTVRPGDFKGDELGVRVLATTGTGTMIVRTDTVAMR